MDQSVSLYSFLHSTGHVETYFTVYVSLYSLLHSTGHTETYFTVYVYLYTYIHFTILWYKVTWHMAIHNLRLCCSLSDVFKNVLSVDTLKTMFNGTRDVDKSIIYVSDYLRPWLSTSLIIYVPDFLRPWWNQTFLEGWLKLSDSWNAM